MAKFYCLSVLVGWKKKSKVEEECQDLVDYSKGVATPQVELKQPVKSSEQNDLNSTSFRFTNAIGIQENSVYKLKGVGDEKDIGYEAVQASYEAEDEHEEDLSIKRELSDFDLQAYGTEREGEASHSTNKRNASGDFIDCENDHQTQRDVDLGAELDHSGHVSDPGIGKAAFWASPGLQRSCSDLITTDVLKKMAARMTPLKHHSFEHLQNFQTMEDFDPKLQGSPESVWTSHSADKVMLRKHSSSQILPSRSRRLWWKLFLWSHRNLEKSRSMKIQRLTTVDVSKQKGGYSSDTLEPNQAKKFGSMESPGSFTGESRSNSPNWIKKFHHGASGLCSENQWVAFPTASSSMTRVDQWVNSLETQLSVNAEETADKDIAFPPSPDASAAKNTSHMNHWSNNVTEEVLYATNVIQSLNASSTVAHIAGMGLKVIPPISGFSSLRSVNLSGNFIVHITPGALPKGLHILNLSRNKIVAIEGLRELTRLRVLDLSYNRITRIGQGLSYCTLIKELNLAGNKISEVEGLHRLLKLMVLDLSFNKIATAKALGQLAANYDSLLALNLLGNPIQSNIGEDRLRKTISGILPQLSHLNKQPIKSNGAREVATAVGFTERASRRKIQRRASKIGSSSSSKHRSSVAGAGQKTSHRSKRNHHHISTGQK